MGLYRNGTRIAKPYQAGNKANAYMEGYKLWADDIPPLFFTSASSFNIKPAATSGKTLYYSIGNSISWTQWNGSSSISVAANKKIYFKSYTTTKLFTDAVTTNKWTLTGSNIEAGGTIQSLFNYSNTVPEYGVSYIFYNNTNLIKAPELPATNLSSLCYSCMFRGCTSLRIAPELPATTLAASCYDNMFSGCTSIVNPPALPATTMVQNCYRSMFYNCSSLTSAPELPATTLAMSCYYSMFLGCTSIVNTPALPATTMVDNCYYAMFRGCASIVYPPALPATTLATSCYREMFYGCTSLRAGPSLYAGMTLAPYCYNSMFRGCTSLTSAPDLCALKLTTSCYAYMFYGCSRITFIRTAFDDNWGTMTTEWVNGVASSGTFEKIGDCPQEMGTSKIPVGWRIMDSTPLTFTSDNAFSITPALENTNNKILTYKLDTPLWPGTTWHGETISVQAGHKVYFRSDQHVEVNATWTITGTNVKASGNIQSLLNYDGSINATNAFRMMFQNCTALITPPRLTSNHFTGANCYEAMFKGCTSLTTAPNLPSTYLTARCYKSMFSGCTALVNAPALSATTLYEQCYYGMFFNCKSLVKAPDLPATTLVNGCYDQMFGKCIALNYMKVYFTSWSNSTTYYWMELVNDSGIASTVSGTFYKKAALPIERGHSRVPAIWNYTNF